jgi:membrane protein
MKKFGGTLVRIVIVFMDENMPTIAGAVAFALFQSLIPLVVGFVVISSLFLQPGTGVRENFIQAIVNIVPQNFGLDIVVIIDTLLEAAPSIISIAAVILIWTGSGIFGQLVMGVNQAFGVKNDRRNILYQLVLRFFLFFWLGGLIAIAITITIVSQLIFNADIELFGISPRNFNFLLPVLSFFLPIVLQCLAFMALYDIGPAVKNVKWRHAFVGGLVASLLFEVLKQGFAFYVNSFNAADGFQRTYGTLGGLLLFLFYLYLSSAIMLIGACVTAVIGDFRPTAAEIEMEERQKQAKAAKKAAEKHLHADKSLPARIWASLGFGKPKKKAEPEAVPPAAKPELETEHALPLPDLDTAPPMLHKTPETHAAPVPSRISADGKPESRRALTIGSVALLLAGIAGWISNRRSQ